MQVDMQSPWWVEALHSVAERGLDTDLCQRVQDELSSTDMDLGSIGRYSMNRLIQNSFNEGRGSRMKDRGSWIEVRRSGTEDRVSSMKDRVWRIEEKGSRMKDWGSRIEVWGSRIEDRGSGRPKNFSRILIHSFSLTQKTIAIDKGLDTMHLFNTQAVRTNAVIFISHTVKVYDISFVQV